MSLNIVFHTRIHVSYAAMSLSGTPVEFRSSLNSEYISFFSW